MNEDGWSDLGERLKNACVSLSLLPRDGRIQDKIDQVNDVVIMWDILDSDKYSDVPSREKFFILKAWIKETAFSHIYGQNQRPVEGYSLALSYAREYKNE